MYGHGNDKRMKNSKRDSKGRFVKGVMPEGAKPFSAGSAKEMQLRSAESRKQNKTLREALREALMEDGGGGFTKMEILARKAMENHRSGKLSFRDLSYLATILGEANINVTLDQDPNTRPEINIE